MGERLLVNQRNRETYFESIKPLSASTQRIKKIAIQSLDRFCYEKFKAKTVDDLIPELKKGNEHQLFDFLQGWINWETIADPKNRFSHINSYLYYFGIKLDSQDVKHNLKFPKKRRREQYAVSRQEIIDIITPTPHAKKALYLALVTSGMRIGEAVRIKRKDIEIGDRIKITIPAEISKNGISRITWMSSEAGRFNINRIRKLDDEDLVWGSSKTKSFEHDVIKHDSIFRNYTDNAKLGMRYPSGTRKITIHSLRSYFITKGNKIEFGFGHALAGHDYYMKNYDRYTQDELYKMYLELEPELAIFDLTKKEMEQQQQAKEIDSLKEEIEKLKQKDQKKTKINNEILETLSKDENVKELIRMISAREYIKEKEKKSTE